MADDRTARDAGKAAFASLRRSVAGRIADVLRRDPDRLSSAIEVGLIDRDWLESPGERPVSSSTPLEVVERFLERSVEQRPSLLASMGLTAIQVLSSDAESDPGEPGLTATLAVAFTDLEGFTSFTAEQGDEAASRLLAEHHRVVGPVVRSRGGRIVKRLGDGLLLTFPAPHAGVLASLELVACAPPPLALRAGVHCGEVVVLRDDIVGHVVNVAARVTEAASGGEVLVTSEVREAVGDDLPLRFGRSRARRFKGVGEKVTVCTVSGPPPALHR